MRGSSEESEIELTGKSFFLSFLFFKDSVSVDYEGKKKRDFDYTIII